MNKTNTVHIYLYITGNPLAIVASARTVWNGLQIGSDGLKRVDAI
jgi:hypothetical protein